MYSSDCGSATSGGTTTSRESCYHIVLSSWNSNEVSDCKIHDCGVSQWAMMSASDLDSAQSVYNLYYTGRIYYFSASNVSSIFPTIFLKTGIKSIDGNGELKHSFVLK